MNGNLPFVKTADRLPCAGLVEIINTAIFASHSRGFKTNDEIPTSRAIRVNR